MSVCVHVLSVTGCVQCVYCEALLQKWVWLDRINTSKAVLITRFSTYDVLLLMSVFISGLCHALY